MTERQVDLKQSGARLEAARDEYVSNLQGAIKETIQEVLNLDVGTPHPSALGKNRWTTEKFAYIIELKRVEDLRGRDIRDIATRLRDGALYPMRVAVLPDGTLYWAEEEAIFEWAINIRRPVHKDEWLIVGPLVLGEIENLFNRAKGNTS